SVSISDGKSAPITKQLTVNIVDIPPSIDSLSAQPQAAGVLQQIAFNASATDPDSSTLTYSWYFGDGSTGDGQSVTHAYTAPGPFNVVLFVKDEFAQAVTKAIVVTVLAPLVGKGSDTDGDGFSDDFENAVGSNPLEFSITPTGSPATAGHIEPLTVT